MPRYPTDRGPRPPAPPLDFAALERLAITYVGRYATTRARLRAYLARKVRERGWADDTPPPVETLVARCATLGYVDDRQFAATRAASLGRRGYGARRVGDALRAAGIEAPDAAPAVAEAGEAEWATAVAFARRRRIGPFARPADVTRDDPERDRNDRRKALAAMLRAGHAMGIAQKLVDMRAEDWNEADDDVDDG